jgi:hypothetical protein
VLSHLCLRRSGWTWSPQSSPTSRQDILIFAQIWTSPTIDASENYEPM